jgi:hypothetical protein
MEWSKAVDFDDPPYIATSKIANGAKALIESGANSSANYAKRVPITKPTQAEIDRASKVAARARAGGDGG